MYQARPGRPATERERDCAGCEKDTKDAAVVARNVRSLSLSHSLSLFILLSRESKRAEREGKGGLARNRARSAQDTIRNVQSFSRAVLVRSFVAFVRF